MFVLTLAGISLILNRSFQVETQIKEAEPPSSEPAVIKIQLKEHKALYDDVSGQKGRVRDVLGTAKKLIRDAAQYDDVAEIREKVDDLKETVDSVSIERDKIDNTWYQKTIE